MPRGDCGARCNTVDPATRWCCALVEAYARRGLAQRRDRCHRPKQPAGLEEDVWISPALAGRDADVPLEGAHRQEPGGAHNWRPGHRGSHPRGRAQSHDLAGTPSVRPYRVNSWGEGKVPVRLDLCNNALERTRMQFLFNKTSNNMNQIAHVMNSANVAGKLTDAHYQEALTSLVKISQYLKSALNHVD